MTHGVKIIYEDYEAFPDGRVRRIDRWDVIPFSEKTTEYRETLSYFENMEYMISDIMETGHVFLNDGVAISFMCIKKFEAYGQESQNKNTQNVQNGQSSQNGNAQKNQQRVMSKKKWQSIRHRNNQKRRIESIQGRNPIKEDGSCPECGGATEFCEAEKALVCAAPSGCGEGRVIPEDKSIQEVKPQE